MKKGYKVVLLVIFFITLSSCGFFSPTSTSSIVPSISFTIPPLPNEDFEKVQENKLILIQNMTEKTFSRENVLTFAGDLLSPINFRETEGVWLPYDVENMLTPTDRLFAETLTPWQSIPSLQANRLYTGQQVLQLLDGWLSADTYFNVVQRERFFKDLSHDVYDIPYYWFNNYVDHQLRTFKRYDHQLIHGEGVIQRTFQTGNAINILETYQVSAQANTLVTIVDQTFPPGWSGARDIKVTLEEAQFDLTTAMTIGPVQSIFNEFAFWKFIHGEGDSGFEIRLQTTNASSFILTANWTQLSGEEDILQFYLEAEVENLLWKSWRSAYTLYREINA
jgi:hypothetical protein